MHRKSTMIKSDRAKAKITSMPSRPTLEVVQPTIQRTSVLR